MKKNIFKIFKVLSIAFLTVSLGFSNFGSILLDNLGNFELVKDLAIKEALAQAQGDGLIFYGQAGNSTPQFRDYINSSDSFGGASGTTAGAVSLTTMIRTSPTKQEAIAGYVTSGGALQIMCYDGTSWTNEWSAIVGGNGSTRRFDIAYETNSGDVMVLYSTNAGTTNELAYRTKQGTTGCGVANWGSATNLNPVRTSGVVQWVKTAWDKRSASNLITAIWADANRDLSAMVWSGTAWGNEPATALETSLEIISTAQDVDDFDVEYESVSGDAMVVWANSAGSNGVNGVRYSTCTGGTASCTWSSILTPPTFADDATNLDISANPLSDEIVFASIGNAGSDLQVGYWSGSAWTNRANRDTNCRTPAVGTKLVSTGWTVSGGVSRSITVYADLNDGRVNWVTGSGGSFNVEVDAFVTPDFGAPNIWYSIDMDPFNYDRFILTVTDINNDLFAKRVVMTSAPAFTWTDSDGGIALEANLAQATVDSSSFAYWRYVPTKTITIGATSGTDVAILTSGATSQFFNDTDCDGPTSCPAFTLSLNTGSETLTSIKITETGTVDATNSLSNVALFYDADGDFANGTLGQFGSTVASFTSESATISGSRILTPGTYYFYVRFDLVKSGSYPSAGQTIGFGIVANTDVTSSGGATITGAPANLAATGSFKPNAISTTYGSGLTDGGRSGESITVSGYGFGVAPAGSRGNCSGGVNTGCIQFVVGGAASVDDVDVTIWTNTSLTFSINPALASNGGALALQIISASQGDETPLTFYIYPNITGMITCPAGGDRDSACGTNASLEYNIADTFGLIQLTGDHFGSSAGTVQFTGAFGSLSGTVHGTTEGACSVGGWAAAGTSVCVEVNPAIGDSVYDGTITLTRTGDSKTDITDLHILPRITANDPTSGAVGGVVAINGNHFCQTGTCPLTPPTTDYIVYFGSTQAQASDFVTTCSGGSRWSHTQVCVKVPSGTPTGIQKTKVQGRLSPLYESQRENFAVQTTVPFDPVVTEPPSRQYKSDNSTVIPLGGATDESTVILKADISASQTINMRLQIEVQPTGTAFTCTGSDPIGSGGCTAYSGGAGVLEGTVGGGGGCDSCISLSQARITFAGLLDSTKHWQARVRNSTTNEYSTWVSYGGNPETAIDFKVDATAPVISNISSGVPGSNDATITWDTSGEASTSQVQYNITGIFVDNCAINNDCTTLDPTLVYNHSVLLSGLDSGTTYYYRVRSKDAADNEAISPVNSFTTSSVNQPSKTTSFHIVGETDSITTAATYYFSALIPETLPSVKSAFVEVTGLVSGGTSPIELQTNSVLSRSYSVNAATPTLFRFIYKIASPNDEINLNLNDADPCTNGDSSLPPCNKLVITPGSGMTVNIYSAKLIMTYGYTE